MAWSQTKRVLICLLYALPILLVLGSLTPYESSDWRCLDCLLDKTARLYCGIPINTYEENECSRWCAAAFPGHVHRWRKSGCTYRGLACNRSVSCGFAHPVFRISPPAYRNYLETHTAKETERIFAQLDSRDFRAALDAIERSAGSP